MSVRQGGVDEGGRRSFMGLLIGGFLSLWGLGVAAVGLSFLKVPDAERRPREGQVPCGSFSALAIGEARFVRHGSTPIVVVRASETGVVALPAICTHMRCVLQWDVRTATLLCPCHQGSFDRNGNVLSGPPSRALVRYPAEIQADEIVVHV